MAFLCGRSSFLVKIRIELRFVTSHHMNVSRFFNIRKLMLSSFSEQSKTDLHPMQVNQI